MRGRAICRTKADWPEAASGPAVTPGNRERREGERVREKEGTRLMLSWLWQSVIV